MNHGFFSRVVLIHGLAGFEAGLRGLAFGCCVLLVVFGMLFPPPLSRMGISTTCTW